MTLQEKFDEVCKALDLAAHLLDYSGCNATGGESSVPNRNIVFNTRDKYFPERMPLSWADRVDWAK